MAMHQSGFVQSILERIVQKPLRATLTVGVSILVLSHIIQTLSLWWPEAGYLRFLVPFVPPFFITRTAKRINQRRAEYDFIKDAEPYIFVAFPEDLSVQSLLDTPASMFSDSAARHFNCTIDALLGSTALPESFVKAEDREAIANALIDNFQKNNGQGTLRNFPVSITPKDSSEPERFIMNSVLKMKDGGLKWQATLTRYETLSDT